MKSRRRSRADLLGDEPPKRGRPVADHRQQLVLAQAEGQQIKNAKMRGELIERAAVELAWAGIVADLRAAFLAAPARIGAQLSLDPATVAALDAECRELLEALSASASKIRILYRSVGSCVVFNKMLLSAMNDGLVRWPRPRRWRVFRRSRQRLVGC